MYSLDMENGPFKGLLSCDEAAKIWMVDSSAIRKAIAAGRLQPGKDCCKFGKQWVVTVDAMAREFRGGMGIWILHLDLLTPRNPNTKNS